MTKFILPFLLISSVLFFSSCVGYSVTTKSEPVHKSTTSKSTFAKKGWKNIPIYEDDEYLLTPYKVISKIKVTGNESAKGAKLLRKMKKEASRYGADAIIFKHEMEIERSQVNGLSAALNIFSIIMYQESADMDTGNDYYALEFEAIAIKFLDKKKKVRKKIKPQVPEKATKN